MNRERTPATDTLEDEVSRYLAVVDVFRSLGCEPTWRPEAEPGGDAAEQDLRLARIETSAH